MDAPSSQHDPAQACIPVQRGIQGVANDTASLMTGSIVLVDGGYVCW
jgi:hypothetical protein